MLIVAADSVALRQWQFYEYVHVLSFKLELIQLNHRLQCNTDYTSHVYLRNI